MSRRTKNIVRVVAAGILALALPATAAPLMAPANAPETTTTTRIASLVNTAEPPAETAQTRTADPAPDPAQLRVGSYNIKNGVPRAQTVRALRAFLARVDLAGLQEVSRHRLARVMRGIDGWGVYRASHGPGILYRKAVLERRHGSHGAVLAEGRYVGHTKGRRSRLPDVVASVAHLRVKATGQRVTLINYHAPAAVETAGMPRAGEHRRVVMHEDSTEGAIRQAKHHGASVAFVTGDLNVDYRADARAAWRGFPYVQYRTAGFEALWAHGKIPARGTHGHRIIDYVWSKLRASEARVLRGIDAGDHYPIVGVYRLPAA